MESLCQVGDKAAKSRTLKQIFSRISGSENPAMSAGDWLKENKGQHQKFLLHGAEEECVQFVAALMDDTAQILMRSVTSFHLGGM